jgi:hypothetical protein
MTCEHWDIDLEMACQAEATVWVECSDEGDVWDGLLCAAHLAQYQADPDTDVTILGDA